MAPGRRNKHAAEVAAAAACAAAVCAAAARQLGALRHRLVEVTRIGVVVVRDLDRRVDAVASASEGGPARAPALARAAADAFSSMRKGCRRVSMKRTRSSYPQLTHSRTDWARW